MIERVDRTRDEIMNNTYKYIEDLAGQLPEIPPDSIISRTIHSDDRIKVVLFGFATGQELSEHTASQPAILTVVEGEAQLTLGYDTLDARAGTWLYMPARMAHSVHANTPLLLLLCLLRDQG